MKVPSDQAALHRLKIGGIFLRKGASAREKKVSIWNYILQNEVMAGTHFLVSKPDRNLYVALGTINEIVPMPRQGRGGDRIFSYLHTMYGLAEREDSTKMIYDVMRSYAHEQGSHVELRRFSAYDHATQTTYLSTYDGYMWKLDGNEITKIQNGEDNIFFIDDDDGSAIEPDINPHGILIDRLTNLNFSNKHNAEHQRKILVVWMFAIAFPDLISAKPLLILEGPPGSGKTSSIEFIKLVLTGSKKIVALSKSQEDEFGVLLLRSSIVILDNVDSYIEWVADKVCAYVTGGSFSKRKLFSDDEEVTIKPHAFIAVASKNPASFKRDDVVDRSLIIRLTRYSRGFKSLNHLEQDLLSIRSKLLGEYIYYCNRIVEEIRAGAFRESENETSRMADFSAFIRVVARVMNWSVEEVDDLMGGIQHEQDAFSIEKNPLFELLNKWLDYKPKNGLRNIGRQVSLQALLSDLKGFSGFSSDKWVMTPQALEDKLKSELFQRKFIIETTISSNGEKSYKIWRHTDAQLTVVPDEEGTISFK